MTGEEARSIVDEGLGSFKRYVTKLAAVTIALSLLLGNAGFASDAALRFAVGSAWAGWGSAPSAFGVSPQFFIIDPRDGWCFDGAVFRECDKGCMFEGKRAGGSSRYLQISKVDDGGTCLIMNKKTKQITTDNCRTGKGKTNENTGEERGLEGDEMRAAFKLLLEISQRLI